MWQMTFVHRGTEYPSIIQESKRVLCVKLFPVATGRCTEILQCPMVLYTMIKVGTGNRWRDHETDSGWTCCDGFPMLEVE